MSTWRGGGYLMSKRSVSAVAATVVNKLYLTVLRERSRASMTAMIVLVWVRALCKDKHSSRVTSWQCRTPVDTLPLLSMLMHFLEQVQLVPSREVYHTQCPGNCPTLAMPLVITCLNTSLIPSLHSTAILACSTASMAMVWLCQLYEGQPCGLYAPGISL